MSTKDSARLTMDSCVGREREDQAVKRLFSRKDFLANIMKGTIAEYADLSIEEIMDCIEEIPFRQELHWFLRMRQIPSAENPQFTAIGEAPAIMDLIFRSWFHLLMRPLRSTFMLISNFNRIMLFHIR